MWPFDKKEKFVPLRDRNEDVIKEVIMEGPAPQLTDPTSPNPKEVVSAVREPSIEERGEVIVDQILKHGFEQINGVYNPPADSMTSRHMAVVSSVIDALTKRERALIQEVANREADLEEVRFTLYGYQQAAAGFMELQKQKEYSAQLDTAFIPTPEPVSDTPLTDALNKAFPEVLAEEVEQGATVDGAHPEQVDNPNLPDAGEEPSPVMDFTAIRASNEKVKAGNK